MASPYRVPGPTVSAISQAPDARLQHLWKTFVNLRELIRPGCVERVGGVFRVSAMDGEKSEFYERKADEFRAVAETMRLTNARLQLLWMARKFERLAERMRGGEQERQAAD